MANTCFTNYVVEGPAWALVDLYQKMKYLECTPFIASSKHAWGPTWLGALVLILNGKINGPEGVYCRGMWCNLAYDGTILTFDTETAWMEMEEFRHFLERHYVDLKIYYRSEEEGNNYYVTNDSDGKYFPDRFIVDIEADDYHEFQTEKEALSFIENLIGRKLAPTESPNEALEDWGEINNTYAAYKEFSVIDN